MRSSRRGYMLLEILVVIAMFGVVAGLILMAILSMMKIDRDFRQTYQQGRTLDQLELQLRDDAAISTSATQIADGISFLGDNKETIAWQLKDGVLHRELATSGEITQRDAYLLPDNATCEWTLPQEATPGVVQLRMVREIVIQENGVKGNYAGRLVPQTWIEYRLRLKKSPAVVPPAGEKS